MNTKEVIRKLKSADSHHTQKQYELDDEAIEVAVESLEIKAKLEELLGIYEGLLDIFNKESGERNGGRIYMTEQVIRDFRELLGFETE